MLRLRSGEKRSEDTKDGYVRTLDRAVYGDVHGESLSGESKAVVLKLSQAKASVEWREQ